MGTNALMVVAFRALEEIVLQFLHRVHLRAILAFMPKTVGCLFLEFGRSLYPVFKALKPTHCSNFGHLDNMSIAAQN